MLIISWICDSLSRCSIILLLYYQFNNGWRQKKEKIGIEVGSSRGINRQLRARDKAVGGGRADPVVRVAAVAQKLP